MKINFKKIAFLGLLLAMFGFIGSNSTFASSHYKKHGYYKKHDYYKSGKKYGHKGVYYKKGDECCEERRKMDDCHKRQMAKRYMKKRCC